MVGSKARSMVPRTEAVLKEATGEGVGNPGGEFWGGKTPTEEETAAKGSGPWVWDEFHR